MRDAGTTAALVPKLQSLDDPAGEALRIAGAGNLWAGRTVADALRRLQTESPRRLREFLPEISKDLDDLVWKMLARKPDERPESARVVMQGLARHAAPMAAHWEVE